MKLFELPQSFTAGATRVRIEELKRNPEPPTRNDDAIFLPNVAQSELFPLLDGKQFLLRIPGTEQDRYGHVERMDQVWFGGTDEGPFLTRLHQESFKVFREKGETGFFGALKPNFVKYLETTFRVTALRQGDIFAVPLPFTWKSLTQHAILFRNEKVRIEELCCNPFGTRHHFNGPSAIVRMEGGNPYRVDHLVVGDGFLEAPDHGPLKLEGIHALAQASHLFTPETAD